MIYLKNYYFSNPTPEEDLLFQNITWPTVNSNDLNNIQYLNINKTLEVAVNPRYYQSVKTVLYEYAYPQYINH